MASVSPGAMEGKWWKNHCDCPGEVRLEEASIDLGKQVRRKTIVSGTSGGKDMRAI